VKTLSIMGALACIISIPSSALAQAMPTATARGSLQFGAGYTYAKPDFGSKAWQGISGFADFDFSSHVGVEADIHYIALITPYDLAEDTYLFGPRFILPFRRFKFYAKGLVGDGNFVIQVKQDNPNVLAGNFFTYSVGGGIDILAGHRVVVRAVDIEYQHWSYLNGLTPTVITVGAAYQFR
jgi:outer membrane protein with beta-barrel domain